jgi:hypothetical protein
MILPGCYKVSVNESETITAAQPLGPVSGRGGRESSRFGFAVVSAIERS